MDSGKETEFLLLNNILSHFAMNSNMKFLQKKMEILSAEGYAVYVLINAKTGKPEIIPEDIKDKYSI